MKNPTLSHLLLFLVFTTLSTLGEGLEIGQFVVNKSVVFLGESHSSETDHQGQLEVLRALLNEDGDRPLILVLEMFNERSPEGLKQFMTDGEVEADFWKQQWGHPYELYRPILQWSRKHGISLTHLRPDPKRTQAVRESDPLGEMRKLGDFYLGPPAYRTHMSEVAQRHLPQDMEVTDDIVDKYFLIQCFWDEYMSWRLTHLLSENPDALLIVLVGHGHLHPEFGIVPRLKRRSPGRETLTIGFEEKSEWKPDLVWAVSGTNPLP